MLSIGFRCVLGHFRRFQVCVILRVGMRMDLKPCFVNA